MPITLPTLPALLDSLVRLASDKARSSIAVAELDATPAAQSRLSATVKPATRIFLRHQAEQLGTSVDALSGLILDGVADKSIYDTAASTTFQRIAERVLWLIAQHGLSAPAAADYLSPLGITTDSLRNPKILEGQMNSERIRSLASFFNCERDWLAGLAQNPILQRRPWYKSPGATAGELLNIRRRATARSARLLIVKPAGPTFDRTLNDEDPSQRFIAFIAREYSHPDENLTTFEPLQDGRWTYQPCRIDIKIFISLLESHGIYADGHTISQSDFELLLQGSTLPASILRSSTISFQPADYATIRTNNAYEQDEWANVVKSDYFEKEFRDCVSVMKIEHSIQ